MAGGPGRGPGATGQGPSHKFAEINCPSNVPFVNKCLYFGGGDSWAPLVAQTALGHKKIPGAPKALPMIKQWTKHDTKEPQDCETQFHKSSHFEAWPGRLREALSLISHSFQIDVKIARIWCWFLTRFCASAALSEKVAQKRCTKNFSKYTAFISHGDLRYHADFIAFIGELMAFIC